MANNDVLEFNPIDRLDPLEFLLGVEEVAAMRRRAASVRLALSELHFNDPNLETPEKANVSADEMIILLRGPRRKPLIWSPVEQHKMPDTRKQSETQNESEEKISTAKKRPSLNSSLRRRLVLSPTKTSGFIGNAVARKLMALPKLTQEVGRN